jgi:hypothetical protein
VFWREGSAGPGPHSTDDEGTLRCTGIPAGEVRVSVDKPGTGDGTASCRVEDGGTATVELELAAPR